MFNKLKNFIFHENGTIRFQLDDWYYWYKDPQVFHDAVVEHLLKEGKTVQTLQVTKRVTSNIISTLIIDGKKYQLSVQNASNRVIVQTAVLKKLDEK
ncbi:hypothetical protein [Neobacillus massiliamazoniensis]|uniref:Uncharacterized protein n=1 Tax=Neobacillus massiliamazoniensis TaxID=1499688 RepID=A0A0U1NU38_9BACI|nr:hypothetical protein [Neobacillus massiliamazoniensis]CRK81262.1 hypothetical protein BN000_01162 [Neobacillus massiliamazoniensis]